MLTFLKLTVKMVYHILYKYFFAWCFLSLLCFCSGGFAGTTGKIAGVIKDKTTNEPLTGVNIFLENILLGNSTDTDGYYSIINVPPGNYTLIAQFIGYQQVIVKNVTVTVDKTTSINLDLQEKIIESDDAVTIIAERSVIQKDLTSTTYVVSADQIKALPVEELEDILTLKAGIVKDASGRLHFRGGRSAEISYLVDGIPVNDVFSGDPILEIEKDFLSQLEVISGTFNAEYGQALSGIVNAITRDGAEKLEIKGEAYLGDYISNHDDIFTNIDEVQTDNVRNLQLSISQPLKLFNRKLFLTLFGRLNSNDGWINGIRRFVPSDSSNFANPSAIFIEETGDSAFVPMNSSERKTLTAKVVYKISSPLKLSYSLFYNDEENQAYNHLFKLNPDGRLTSFKEGTTHLFKINHTLSTKLFYDLSLALLQQENKSFVFEDPFDPRYQNNEKLIPKGSSFLTGGTEMTHLNRATETMMVKTDATYQLNNAHLFKSGLELKLHDLQFEEFEIQKGVNTDGKNLVPDIDSPFHNQYQHKPIEFAAYLQDKIELGDLIVNAGLRFDYFDSRGDIPLDPRDPNNRIRNLPGNRFEKASAKKQLSPRIGLSYPITETSILRTSYGHFFQIPPFDFLYSNPEFEVIPNSLSTRTGNADFEPQRTVTYEVGLQQMLTDDWFFDLTGFFKDIRNLTGQEIHELYILGDRYAKFINRDFGNVRGITFSLSKTQLSGGTDWGFNFDYTYQIAQGNASDPDQAFLANQSTPPADPEKQLSPLDWDQRHTINFALSLGDLNRWGTNFIGRLGSGMPYTPEQSDDRSFLENSARKPLTYSFDLKIFYNIPLLGSRSKLYVNVFNLFDRRNELSVYSDTGRAGFNLSSLSAGGTRFVNSIQDFVLRPDFYSEPRRILFGFNVALGGR